jgi:hypothetical protein
MIFTSGGSTVIEKMGEISTNYSAHIVVPISDPLHLERSFRYRLLKCVIMMPTTNGKRPVNLSLMKKDLGITPALNDLS